MRNWIVGHRVAARESIEDSSYLFIDQLRKCALRPCDSCGSAEEIVEVDVVSVARIICVEVVYGIL